MARIGKSTGPHRPVDVVKGRTESKSRAKHTSEGIAGKGIADQARRADEIRERFQKLLGTTRPPARDPGASHAASGGTTAETSDEFSGSATNTGDWEGIGKLKASDFANRKDYENYREFMSKAEEKPKKPATRKKAPSGPRRGLVVTPGASSAVVRRASPPPTASPR